MNNDLLENIQLFVFALSIGLGLGILFTANYWKKEAIKHGAAEYRLVTSNKQDVIFLWKHHE